MTTTTTTTTTTTAGRPAGTKADSSTGRTRAQLACGAIAGPLFVGAVVLHGLTRAGFDPKHHPLSLLSLGALGWIQIGTFVLCGALILASVPALRRVLHPGRAGTWGPVLVGVYGAGLVWGGVFVADPAFGFPPGTPDGAPVSMSWHGILHAVAPAMAGVAVTAVCLVFARRYAGRGQPWWAGYCVASAVLDLALTGASFGAADYRLMFAGGAFTWICVSAVAAHLLAGVATPARPRGLRTAPAE